jgi:hypothetical protein
MTSRFNDPAYWRDRAEELRLIAERLEDSNSKAQLLACARDYDILADRAEEHRKSSGNPTLGLLPMMGYR